MNFQSVTIDMNQSALDMPGNDLLSHILRCSTIGAGAFHGRVRDGIGCSRSAIITRQIKRTVLSPPAT